MITARIPSLARRRPSPVPEFDSLIVPVRGDLAPTDRREDVGALVPVTIPGEKTSLLFGPSGWQVAGTSSWTMLEVSHRPARWAYLSGSGSKAVVRSVMFTRRIRSMLSSSLSCARMIPKWITSAGINIRGSTIRTRPRPRQAHGGGRLVRLRTGRECRQSEGVAASARRRRRLPV